MADLQRIKERIMEELALRPAKHERGKYVCPLCGHETWSLDPQNKTRGKCFHAGCEVYGDVFDWRAAIDGISLQEATRRLIEKYEPGAAGPRRSSPEEDFSDSYRPAAAEAPADVWARRDEFRAQALQAAAEQPSARKDYLPEIEAAHQALKGSEGERYLLGRGFTPETLERFKLGYVPSHFFPGWGQFSAVVFPYDRGGHYVGWRAIAEKHYDKPKTAEAGEEPVFNAAALYQGGPCFVVESQLCAISIEQEGGRAVAIGGSGERKLLRQLEKKAPAGPLILALDNDEPGRAAQEKLAAELERKGLPFLQGNPSGDHKDPNEQLQANREELRANIAAILREVDETRQREERERLEARQQESAAGYLDNFLEELRQSKAAPAISTGFKGLDKLLDGGLYPGLYVIGAITSLGKSTFTLQIADNIAAEGHDVLCFNLEMARKELISKSVSRISFQTARNRERPARRGLSTRDIMNPQKWQYLNRDDMQLMASALDQYKATSAPHIWHYEGVGDIGVEQVKAEVERHIGITGRLPVVVIDYVQILASPDVKMSDKQAVDKNVLELKRLSRDKGIPVFCISSLNRDNYTEPINNAAFKESGAIEYSSDCLMGLQFLGMDYQEKEKDGDRLKRIRSLVKEQRNKGNHGQEEEIELKILKNRNGMAGTSETLLYTPRFNHYEEKSEFTEVDGEAAGLPDEWKEEQPAAVKRARPL